MRGQPKLTLLSKSQGHPRVMIYTHFVELHCLMLHAKLQNHRPSGSGEEDFKVFAIYLLFIHNLFRAPLPDASCQVAKS